MENASFHCINVADMSFSLFDFFHLSLISSLISLSLSSSTHLVFQTITMLWMQQVIKCS